MGMLERSLRKYSDDKLHEIINENPDNFGDRVLVLARQELASRQDQEMENRHNGVKTYKIFANPQGQQDAVKQGWSWPGYFFNFFWALKKKMWGLGIGLFILFSVLWGIEGAIEDLLRKGVWETGAITNFLYLLNAIIFGAKE